MDKYACFGRTARGTAAGTPSMRGTLALILVLLIGTPGLAQDHVDHDLDPEILALEGDPEYGAYLAGECTTCHQADGGNQGIPSIVHWPEEDFVIAMHAYRTKQRANPVMQMIAGRLGDEEIAALAAYFATIEQ